MTNVHRCKSKRVNFSAMWMQFSASVAHWWASSWDCNVNLWWENQLNKSYHSLSSEGFNASALHLRVSLNGLREARWTWIHMLIYPFMHGAWIKAQSDRCSVDMSHRGRRYCGDWIRGVTFVNVGAHPLPRLVAFHSKMSNKPRMVQK